MRNKTIKAKTILFFGDSFVPCRITMEVSDGIGIHVIGAPDERVKEMLLRVVSVLDSNGVRVAGKKIVVYFQTEGKITAKERAEAHWELVDLPLALCFYEAAGAVAIQDKTVYIGELRLDGTLHSSVLTILPYINNYLIGEDLTLVAPCDCSPRVCLINKHTSLLPKNWQSQ